MSNLNSRDFYVFLFNLISYVEREFAYLIESNQEIAFKSLRDIMAKDVNLISQLDTIEKRFKNDKEKGNENDYKEYLYIHHLIRLLEIEGKYKNLGYTKTEDFILGTGKLKELRNTIAHPVKSLVICISDLDKLDKGLNKLYEFKERVCLEQIAEAIGCFKRDESRSLGGDLSSYQTTLWCG